MKQRMRAGLALLFIFGLGGISGAEDLTITTYYPSPRGVYDQLETTGDTFLATGPGGQVEIGSRTAMGNPAEKLKIVGAEAPAPGVPTTLVVDSGWSGAWVSLGSNAFNSVDLNVGSVDLHINNDPNPATRSSTFLNEGLGNVGIGLSATPSAKLHVVSADAGLDPLRVDTATIARSLLVDKGGWVSIASNPSAPFELRVGGGILVEQGLPACPPPPTQGGLAFNEMCVDTGVFSNADGELVLYANSGPSLYIYNHPPQRVTIDPWYPVGIGFTSGEVPTARLHVFSGAAPEGFRVDDTIIGDPTPFIINNVGKVGIGTTSLNSKLAISGNVSIGADYVTFVAPNDGVIIQGKVGIGTTSPAAGTKLDVAGEVKIDGISGDGTGKVVCIKADKTLGTCDNAPNGLGECFCQ